MRRTAGWISIPWYLGAPNGCGGSALCADPRGTPEFVTEPDAERDSLCAKERFFGKTTKGSGGKAVVPGKTTFFDVLGMGKKTRR